MPPSLYFANWSAYGVGIRCGVSIEALPLRFFVFP